MRTYSDNSELVTRRRQHILKKAMELFQKKGYQKTTTREIAKACDMSVGSLYHYIGSKDDIFTMIADASSSILEQFSKEDLEGTEISATEKLRFNISQYIKLVDEHQDIILFWYQESKNLRKAQRKIIFDIDGRLSTRIEKILLAGCENGEFTVRDTTLTAHDIIVLCDMWAFRRWFLRKRYSLEDYIRNQSEVILNAICRGKGREPNR